MYHPVTQGKYKQSVLKSILNPFSCLRVIFASSAFGLGIDGKGFETIIHDSTSSDVEEYIQVIGRGGRDGLQVVANLFR